MTNEDLKKLSEMLSTLIAIRKMRKDLNDANALKERIQKIRERAEALNGKEGWDNKLLFALNSKLQDAKSSLNPENIEPLLSYQEKFARNIVENLSDAIIPTSVKGELYGILDDRNKDINIDEIEKSIVSKLNKDEVRQIERITAEIDTANPNKEIVKSFLTMAEALHQTIKDINKAIDKLEEYLNDFDKTITQTETIGAKSEAAQKEEAQPQEEVGVAKEATEEVAVETEIKKEMDEAAVEADKGMFDVQKPQSGPTGDLAKLTSMKMKM